MANVNLEKAKRAFNTIKQEWYKNGEMSPIIFKKVISTCIFPIFDYGCPQWCMFVMRLTKEALKLKIARFFLGVSRLHPIHALENNMGWRSASERLFFRKVSIMESNRLCYMILQYMKRKITPEVGGVR